MAKGTRMARARRSLKHRTLRRAHDNRPRHAAVQRAPVAMHPSRREGARYRPAAAIADVERRVLWALERDVMDVRPGERPGHGPVDRDLDRVGAEGLASPTGGDFRGVAQRRYV